MPRIIFITHNGSEHVVDAPCGRTVMQAAVDSLVPGILGQCSGDCTCGTCHCYLDGDWPTRVAPPSDDERAMLEFTPGVHENSRLSCQLPVSEQLDGIVLRLPESQL
ncbi:2Fe-2S iron-sulfur cluster-binding protein [Massilia putida]|uniref:2Fe-2S iron-sulfur cluster-binding protein n=1 Tax=Massilia putida TaxID=1141883 RepID=UPI00095299E6|nr:2Fe-2S iron-sulfur cluster-binding protein [Massilia putida]